MIIAVVVFVLFMFGPWGYAAIKFACSKDGGVHIYDQKQVAGYFSDETERTCYDCFYELGSGKFEYVDVRATDQGEGGVDFFRLSISNRGDERCEWWYEFRGGRTGRYMMENDQCVARIPLEAENLSNVSSVVNIRDHYEGPIGVDLFVSEHVIKDRSSGRLLAVHRHYEYVTWMQGLTDIKSPAWQCSGERYPKFQPKKFRAAALGEI